MGIWKHVRWYLNYVYVCGTKGHAVNQDVLDSVVSGGQVRTTCVRCGALLDVFINPDNNKYRYRAVY